MPVPENDANPVLLLMVKKIPELLVILMAVVVGFGILLKSGS